MHVFFKKDYTGIMRRIDFLSSLRLFQGLSDRELDLLCQSAAEKRYAPGQCLICDSESSDRLFLIREGRVKLTKVSGSGKEQTLQVYEPGDIAGLFSLFTGTPFPAAAVALEECQVLLFNRTGLERLARESPSLMVNLFYVLATRQAECIRTVGALALKETPQRLAAYLLAATDKEGGSGDLVLAYSHRELSKILGTTPETLSRVLTRLTQEGLIEQNGRQIHIRDRDALRLLDGEGDRF